MKRVVVAAAVCLKVVSTKNGKTTAVKADGPGIKALEKIFKRHFPKSGPFVDTRVHGVR